MFMQAYAGNAAWNETYLNYLRFSELLVVACAKADDKKQEEIYAEMHQIHNTDGGSVVLVFNN